MTKINLLNRISILVITLFVTSISVYAQDIITMQNGDEIRAKVTEISSSEIRYRRFENLEGPIIVIPRAGVFFITYESGTREIINELGTARTASQSTERTQELHYNWFLGTVRQDGKALRPNQVREVMSTNSRALQQYNTGMIFNTVSSVSAGVFFGFWAYCMLANPDGSTPWIVTGCAFGVFLPTAIVSWSIIGNSTKTYNSGLRGVASYQIDFGFTQTGVGLTMRF